MNPLLIGVGDYGALHRGHSFVGKMSRATGTVQEVCPFAVLSTDLIIDRSPLMHRL